jgi:hypothetical protein
MPAPIRARDVRVTIQEQGFEKGIVTILERMCDERSGDRQTMREMAEVLRQCIDNVDKMVNVGENMKVKLQEVERREQQYREVSHLPPSNDG